MSLPALSRISSFSDNTSSPCIFNIFKCPVMSCWQSLNAWYSVIIFPFTVTEPQFVPERIPIPHLSIFGIFTNNLFCFTFTCLNAWMRFEYLCTSIEQICLVFDWQANCQGSARGFLGEFNNFELSPKKRRIVKEHYIYKQSIYRSLVNSHVFAGEAIPYGSYTCMVTKLPVIKLQD